VHCDLPALCLTALRFAALLARDVPAHDLRPRRERTPEHLLQCSVQVSTLPGVPVAQSPRDFARSLPSWPWTSRVGSAVRPAIVSCLLQSYSLRPARIVNSLVVILLHTHPNFILVFTTRCENLLLFPCTLRLPIPVPCCPKDHACTHAMLPRAHLFSVVTSRSVASAGLLTRVTIFLRSTSIKPQCFGCLWRLHHDDQTGTSGFSGSRYFLPAFFGWCRGTS